MEQHKFFISHANDDKDVAELLASLLKKITLDQLSPWYSSDTNAGGGIEMGKMWFNAIIEQIEESKVLVPLLTPNSISSSWLYFESGIAQSLKKCDIIPVCVGIDKNNIYPPLSQYQAFQLSDYRSIKEFIEKLSTKFDITFNEELAKSSIEATISKISKIEFNEIESDPKTNELIKDLKNHIDKRFIEIWERPNLIINDSHLQKSKIYIKNEKTSYLSYSIEININLPKYKSKQMIEIRELDTFTDTLTTIFFLINEYVKPYTYMESWILRDKLTDKHIIIKEIGDMIPSKYIFNKEMDIEVIPLETTYIVADSIKRISVI